MKVLALSSYPVEAAATRFRIAQYIEPLREVGIEIELKPFLDSNRFSSLYSSGNRISKALSLLPPLAQRLELLSASDYDAVFIQREAMLLGPPVFEWFLSSFKKIPMILDLDDATYVPYESPSFGRLGSIFKTFWKTDALISRAEVVICGNQYIADHVESKGKRAVVISTTVDSRIFKPIPKYDRTPVIGWIGTHSTFPLLEKIFPAIQKVAESHRFVLRIAGSGKSQVSIPGVEVELLDWNMDREPYDFADMDIGLYPLSVIPNASVEWLAGKSGFKAIQYLAVGIPFVMTPIGVCATIGRDGITHFNANNPDDWRQHLATLLSDHELRTKMGAAGRSLFLEEYNQSLNIDALRKLFRELGA